MFGMGTGGPSAVKAPTDSLRQESLLVLVRGEYPSQRKLKYKSPTTFQRKVAISTSVEINVSNELSSRLVSKQVFSPQQSLTSVFGMGTGGPSAIKSLTKDAFASAPRYLRSDVPSNRKR